MSRFCSILLLLLTALNGGAGELSLVAGEDLFLFGGRPGSAPITFRNEKTESNAKRVEWRLFQASAATVAPIGERVSLGEREFPGGQDSVLAIALEPPEVRTITTFLLKLWAGEDELGQVRITVCPTNLFSQLRGMGIDVQEPRELIEPLLKGAENEGERKLSIVHLPNRGAEWNAGELAPSVLYIVGQGVQGSEKLMPLKFSRDEGRSVAIMQEWFIPDLKENALSQLRLLRAIDLMLKPEQVQGPERAR